MLRTGPSEQGGRIHAQAASACEAPEYQTPIATVAKQSRGEHTERSCATHSPGKAPRPETLILGSSRTRAAHARQKYNVEDRAPQLAFIAWRVRATRRLERAHVYLPDSWSLHPAGDRGDHNQLWALGWCSVARRPLYFSVLGRKYNRALKGHRGTGKDVPVSKC